MSDDPQRVLKCCGIEGYVSLHGSEESEEIKKAVRLRCAKTNGRARLGTVDLALNSANFPQSACLAWREMT